LRQSALRDEPPTPGESLAGHSDHGSSSTVKDSARIPPRCPLNEAVAIIERP
jgi:hypothetical protein